MSEETDYFYSFMLVLSIYLPEGFEWILIP